MVDAANPNANLSAVAMVTIKGLAPNSKNVSKTANLDIVLILDTSDSMKQENRMETMKNLILYLINSILKENHRLGVVSFEKKANRLVELTPATKEKKKLASDIINAIEPSGDTNTYEGLLAGLQMAYEGKRKACVMLFTDGNPSAGKYQKPDVIVREIKKEINTLKSSSLTSRVDLHAFGIFGYHDLEGFLLNLAKGVGDGNYHNVDKGTDIRTAFVYVVSNAINQVAEDIQLTISPSSDRIEINEAITKFNQTKEGNKLIIKIPTLAVQQSRHIPLDLTVLPVKEKANYEELFSVEMTYKNVITQSVETCDEYLYVARTRHLNGVNPDVNEQLNRVQVAKKLHHVIKDIEKVDREGALRQLRKAENHIQESVTKNSSLSMCMRDELAKLILMVQGNLHTIITPLNESMESHWQEKGGWNSCYLTRKEDTMITVVEMKMKRGRKISIDELYELMIFRKNVCIVI